MMNKITNISLNSKQFVQYARSISGLFLATTGDALTDTDVRLIYLLKLGFKQKKIDYISKQLRAELAHLLELKPQTLYNRISDLKKKGALLTEGKKTKLSPMFGDRMNVNINYNLNEDRKFQNSIAGEDTGEDGI